MDRTLAKGPNIPGVNFRGPDWAILEGFLVDELHEIYRRLAHHDTTWEKTLSLRGEASFIERMLNLPNLAGTFIARDK